MIHNETLLEVLLVVEGEVVLMEALAIRVIDIMSESVHQEMELKPQTEQRPVLIHKLGEQGLAIVANVLDILHGEGVKRIYIQLHGLRLLCLGFLLLRRSLLGLLLLCLLTLCSLFSFLNLLARLGLLLLCRLPSGLLSLLRHLQGPFPSRVLELLLLLLPAVDEPVPLAPLVLEPVGRLQVLYSLSHLPLQHPLLQVLLALWLFEPHVVHRVKAFFLCRKCKLWVREG
mmetsp:Transcript_66372/g.119457  ORF Transcript_66372/g.119457 Transcript_66372/m.119457 type:complete len:229 (-) Transcript_66372:1661-2347(-)